MRSFPWVVLPAYAVLMLAPWINRWFDHHAARQQRARLRWMQQHPDRTHQAGSLRSEITRHGPGRELDRREP